jgi:hypothetical protein
VDRRDRVRLLAGRIVVALGLAAFVWSLGVLVRQDLDPTGTIGLNTGYDGAVVHVDAGSPAAAAGIRRGDVIDFASAHAPTARLGDLGRIAVAPAHAPLPLGTVVSFALARAGAAPRHVSLTTVPATSPSLAEQLLRLLVALLLLGFCGLVLWKRTSPSAFAAFVFALGANPFAFYVQLVPLPGTAWWIATVALIDLLVAAAFGAVVLLSLAFPPRRLDGSGWEQASGFRSWYLGAALAVAAVSFAFQLGLDLPPIVAGAQSGPLFGIDVAFDSLVAAFGLAALVYRWRTARDDAQRVRVFRWTVLAYTLAIGGLILQVYLTYAPPSEAVDLLAKRLSWSGLFMAIVLGYSIVRHGGYRHRIGRPFVRAALSGLAFITLPPLEERASDAIRSMNAPEHGEQPLFSLATLLVLGLGWGGLWLHNRIDKAIERGEHQEHTEAALRKRIDEDAKRYAASGRAAFVASVAHDPVDAFALSAAAVFERAADGAFVRIAVAYGAGAEPSGWLPAYFRPGECSVGADDELVRIVCAQPAPVPVPRRLIAVGAAARADRWALLAAPLRGDGDAGDLPGFAVFARASERKKPRFRKYELGLLAHDAARAGSALAAHRLVLPSSAVEVLEIDASHRGLELLRSFRYRFAAEAGAFDVEDDLHRRGSHDDRRRVVLALVDGTPEGGALVRVHAGCGFVELLTVAERYRTTMLGHQLVEAVADLVREHVRARGDAFVAVLRAASDPFRRPAGADRREPFERAGWLGQLGFSHVALPYAEPAARGADPAGGAILTARPAQHGAVTLASPAVVAALRAHHLHAAPDRQPDADPAFRATAAYAQRHRQLALEPLELYAGLPDQTLRFEEIDLRDEAQFDYFGRLYTEILPPSPSAFTPDEMRHYVREEFPRIRPRRVYRLLGFGGAPGAPDGFLSYFTLNGCGFAGYVGLRRAISHGGVLRRVVAYAERTMCVDDLGAQGWYAEVDEEPPRGVEHRGANARTARAALFRRYGFYALDVPYEPPPLTAQATVTKPTTLLYKPFGAVYGPPVLEPSALLAAVEEIFRVVYLVPDPLREERYRRLAAALRRRDHVPVRSVP